MARSARREFLGQGRRAHGAIAHPAGVVTALPLLWFASAAKRLPLSTLGLFQYLAPSITRAHGVAFGCIWTALVVYSMDAVRAQRTRRSGQLARREPFVVS
ncbi:MAG TPA: hypothetical protein VK714_18025 [Myxococcota bacterium]|nr:hypothetical protein [Myxococcota bacterium]